jgi:hypothetical protein
MRLVFSALLTLLPTAALALMPPHTNNIDPPNGSELSTRVITVTGYTLGGLDTLVKLTGPKGEVVPFAATVKCTSEGKGDAPGAVQQRCEGQLRLTGPLTPGQTVTMNLFRETVVWKVPAAGLSLPPVPAPKAP